MEVTVEDMEFDALIPALASNKVDIVAAGMTVTPERQESVNLQIPTRQQLRLLS